MTGENDLYRKGISFVRAGKLLNSALFFIEHGQKRPHETTLAKVVRATFEKMGFMESEPTDEEPVALTPLAAVIEILSPIRGKIFFSAPQHLGWTIAENLYGLEDLTLEVVGDMISELLNTITGSLLSELMPDQQFNLSIPRLCAAIPSGKDNTFVYHFNIDNNDIITIVLTDKDS
jgi:CheY-specific phosphatase CheX